MNVDLSKLNTMQLALVGDALLRGGDVQQAELVYRQILDVAPRASHVHARLGLALAPNRRTPAALDALIAVEAITSKSVFLGEGLATWFKTLPFVEDDRFMDLSHRHADLLPVPGWQWNLQTVLWAVLQARGLDGDFVELGVFKGHTTRFVADYVGFADWPRLWWLYDTFEGIPPDQMDSGWARNNVAAYEGTFSYESVAASFSDCPNIRVIKGRVPEILRETAPDRIAFLHVDLNNAAAEVAALDILYDRIVPGGVIVFDDYLWLVSRAQYEAEKLWFEARGLVILPAPTGQGVFVKPVAGAEPGGPA